MRLICLSSVGFVGYVPKDLVNQKRHQSGWPVMTCKTLAVFSRKNVVACPRCPVLEKLARHCTTDKRLAFVKAFNNTLATRTTTTTTTNDKSRAKHPFRYATITIVQHHATRTLWYMPTLPFFSSRPGIRYWSALQRCFVGFVVSPHVLGVRKGKHGHSRSYLARGTTGHKHTRCGCFAILGLRM